MKLFDRLKSKSGFTLTELGVVPVALAVVVTLVISFVATFERRAFSVEGSGERISDVNCIQNTVRDRIASNDSIKTNDKGEPVSTVNIVDGHLVSETKSATETLSYENDSLVWTKNGVHVLSAPLQYVYQCKEGGGYEAVTQVSSGGGTYESLVERMSRFTGGSI